MSTDIGLNPWGTRHDRVEGGVATVAGLKFGDIVLYDTAAAGQGRAVTNTTTPGAGPIRGVVVTQTDPTNGCAVGDNLEICTEGVVEVNIAASQTITKGGKIICSATAGAGKPFASESTPSYLGRANMDLASNANVTRICVELNIQNA